MKNVESTEHYSNLIKALKERTSCKVPKTNCFLTPGEISAHIETSNWKYIETPRELYFVYTDDQAVHLYYYFTTEEEPETKLESELPIMVDFVLKERELEAFNSGTMPAWERSGYSFYKKYQRMRFRLTENSAVKDNMDCQYLFEVAQEEQAEEIRTLWKQFLDEYDTGLPSLEETVSQIQQQNVICCMDRGKICGAILVEVSGRSGLIQHVTVHRDYRKRAIGEHMIKYVYHHMKSKGVTDFKLWVDVENVAAIRLYIKSGFNKDNVYSVKLMKR